MQLTEARLFVAQATQELSQIPTYIPDNLSVHIHYGPHRGYNGLGDFEGFRRRLDHTDIFIPELLGWDERFKSIMNATSKGNRQAYQEGLELLTDPDDAFYRRMLEALLSRYVSVEFIDIGQDDPLFKPAYQLSPYGETAERKTEKPKGLNDESYLDWQIDDELVTQHDFVISDMCRNAAMISRFGPKTSRLIGLNRKLRKQQRVRTLLTVGSMHEIGLTAALSQAAGDPDRITVSHAFEKPVFDELEMIHVAGINGLELTPQQQRLLCLRGLFSRHNEGVFYSKYQFAETWVKLGKDRRREIMYAISASLTPEELRIYMNKDERGGSRFMEVAEKVVELSHIHIDHAADQT
jgi:hypothetical protein